MNNTLNNILNNYEVSRDTLVAVEVDDNDSDNCRLVYHFANEYTAAVQTSDAYICITVSEEWDVSKTDSKVIVASIDKCFIALDAISRLASANIEPDKREKRLEKRMKREAISRLYDLGISEKMIREFRKTNTVFVSGSRAICETIDAYPELPEMISQVEKQRKILVYHVVKGFDKSFGDNIFFLLYVSNDMKKWGLELGTFPYDREAYVAAYKLDLDIPSHNSDTTIAVREHARQLICLSC